MKSTSSFFDCDGIFLPFPSSSGIFGEPVSTLSWAVTNTYVPVRSHLIIINNGIWAWAHYKLTNILLVEWEDKNGAKTEMIVVKTLKNVRNLMNWNWVNIQGIDWFHWTRKPDFQKCEGNVGLHSAIGSSYVLKCRSSVQHWYELSLSKLKIRWNEANLPKNWWNHWIYVLIGSG